MMYSKDFYYFSIWEFSIKDVNFLYNNLLTNISNGLAQLLQIIQVSHRLRWVKKIMELIMRVFELSSIMTFGKYKNRSLKDAFETRPSYIDWCLREVDYFKITHKTLEKLKQLAPKYIFTAKAKLSIISNNWINQEPYQDDVYCSDRQFNQWRKHQYPVLQGKSDYDVDRLFDECDAIGCDPGDLTANLD